MGYKKKQTLTISKKMSHVWYLQYRKVVKTEYKLHYLVLSGSKILINIELLFPES